MEKYKWTTTQIDDEDFWLLYDLEFEGDIDNKQTHDDQLMTIDEVRQRALNGEFK